MHLFPEIWHDAEDWTAETLDKDWWGEDDCDDRTVDDPESKDEQPLYHGSPITLGASLLLILAFAFRHGLTGTCLSDLLVLVSLHCPKPNLCITTLHLFRKFFSMLNCPLKVHQLCSQCSFLLEGHETPVLCAVCHSDLTKPKAKSYFVEVPLVAQLQDMFNRPGFIGDLQYRFRREKRQQNNIEDIYDGRIYRNHFENEGFLSDPHNISFMMYTDGVPLFKASNFSIWPLCFVINELPYQKRMKKDNMLFAGIWFGCGKPPVYTYLKPFSEMLKCMEENGVQISLPDCQSKITVKAMLLCCTCDMPAKAMVLNMIQFNGRFGCPRCLQPGKSVQTGKGSGHVWTFPFNKEDICGPKRTDEQFRKDGEQAFRTSKKQNGVKGQTWLSLTSLNLVNGIAIDYMHTVLLGVVRRLLSLWFDSQYGTESFSVAKLVDVVDSRVAKLKPPHFITRLPRSIREHSSHWKASECRSWLYYYSVPILETVLQKDYFQHYLLFVEAMFMLSMESLSVDHVDHCERLLMHFVCMYQTLYGDRFMTSNIHQLLHLCDCVRDFGPLWVTSCFSLEDLNGKLTKLFHGTQHPDIQIANAVCTVLKMPLLSQGLKNNLELLNFYNSLTTKGCTYNDSGSIQFLGCGRHIKLSPSEFEALTKALGYMPGPYVVYQRLLAYNFVYHTRKYGEKLHRNSFCVEYKDAEDNLQHGYVESFVAHKPLCSCISTVCGCPPTMYCVVRRLLPCQNHVLCEDTITNAKLSHIFVGNMSNLLEAIYASALCTICVCVTSGDRIFCIPPPNMLEFD